MVATASIVLLGVMAGANAIQAARAAHPAAAPAISAAQQSPAMADASVLPRAALLDTGQCHVTDPPLRMLTPEQIARPASHGYRLNAAGHGLPCVVSGLVVPAAPVQMSQRHGQVILVSTRLQWLWAYQDGRMVFATPVTTGMAHLRTPHGTYSITFKESDVTFYSPWPRGSPYYYSPEHINYALRFRAGGYYIHDAPWRHAFGPGTQDPHTGPDGTREVGSHGCVNVTTGVARWLYMWAHIGATVTIV